jgi:uncharacterized protein
MPKEMLIPLAMVFIIASILLLWPLFHIFRQLQKGLSPPLRSWIFLAIGLMALTLFIFAFAVKDVMLSSSPVGIKLLPWRFLLDALLVVGFPLYLLKGLSSGWIRKQREMPVRKPIPRTFYWTSAAVFLVLFCFALFQLIDPPLNWAGRQKHPLLSRLLLIFNFSVNRQDAFGGTPLVYACRNQQVDLARKLLRAGADPNLRSANEWTPLMEACRGDDVDLVRVLITSGADVNAGTQYETPLSLLGGKAGKNSAALASARLLLERGCRKESIQQTFFSASAGGNNALLELLLEKGANLSGQDSRGDSALIYAVRANRMASVQLLLSLGTNVNLANHQGCTALHFTQGSVADENASSILRLLLEKSPAIDYQDRDGWSALFHAAARGEASTAAILLEHGANPELKDHAGTTPLMWAASAGSASCLDVLLKRGASLALTDKAGLTARDHAWRVGHPEIALKLKERGK